MLFALDCGADKWIDLGMDFSGDQGLPKGWRKGEKIEDIKRRRRRRGQAGLRDQGHPAEGGCLRDPPPGGGGPEGEGVLSGLSS
jgi:hypothetical protein